MYFFSILLYNVVGGDYYEGKNWNKITRCKRTAQLITNGSGGEVGNDTKGNIIMGKRQDISQNATVARSVSDL